MNSAQIEIMHQLWKADPAESGDSDHSQEVVEWNRALRNAFERPGIYAKANVALGFLVRGNRVYQFEMIPAGGWRALMLVNSAGEIVQGFRKEVAFTARLPQCIDKVMELR